MKVLISAGEVSGDQHLARVVTALRLQATEVGVDLQVRGMAGRSCREAGAQLDVDCYHAGAGMGFFELFRSGGKIFSSFNTLSKLCREWQPDLLIVVDYPDFNLRLAKVAKRHGVKVLYFIPPKVWAWRSSRVKTISRYVDQIAAIFPFEPEFYARYGFTKISYVGHPLSERANSEVSASDRSQTVLFLPGSRKFEVERLLVPMLVAFDILRPKHPELKPVVLLAPNISEEWVRGVIGDRVSSEVLRLVEWSHKDALGEMYRAKVGVLKSGTCNLEGAIAGLPFVCVYSGTLLAKVIVSTFVALREYSPVNIIRARTVNELMRRSLSPVDVANEVERLLSDSIARQSVIDGLKIVRRSLCEPSGLAGSKEGRSSVSQRVAQMVFDLVGRGLNVQENSKISPST